MTPLTFRVAAVQAVPGMLDLDESLARTERWANQAAGQGAKLVVFPETWIGGYPAWLDVSPGAALWDDAGAKAVYARLHANSLAVPSPASERLAALARALAISLVVGANERVGKSLYNSMLIFGPDGELANHHRKLVPTYSERMLWGAGDGEGLTAPQLTGVHMGGLVCWEHWMPLARQALHDQSEQIHAALWPWVKEMNLVASRHYAFEGRCFVVAAGALLAASDLPAELPAAPSVAEEGWLLRGGSAVIAPDGRLLAGPVLDRETVVVADCDLEEIARESLTLDVSGHYRRPDVFQLDVDRRRR